LTKTPTLKDIHPIVVEERSRFEEVLSHLKSFRTAKKSYADYNAELIGLRDAISDARPEDIPPLVEQMTRIQSLAAQRGMGEDIPVDPLSPYFGLLRLKEGDEIRSILLGKHTYLSSESGIHIVDWRNAPISRVYYSYGQGDDYEEEFGGRKRQGFVHAKRSVMISGAQLKRVACAEGVFTRRQDRWIEVDSVAKLSGGQGVSIRAEGLTPVRGVLGVDADGVERRDKHLPEIAALLDKEQFQLISSPHAGLIIVQGSAGSGKTTVGLHRIAYLAYQEPKRFNPRRMMVVVFNEALATYVSRVLPALGIEHVRTMTFTRWATIQRRKHVRGLSANRYHCGDTPSVVTRLKKHPAMLRILDEIVDVHDEKLTHKLLTTIARTPDVKRFKSTWKALQRLPLDTRRNRTLQWIKGNVRVRRDSGKDLHPRTVVAAESALLKMERESSDVLSTWADLFTDREALGAAVALHAPAEFTDGQLDDVQAWCTGVYNGLEDGQHGVGEIDEEDEAILLRIHQLKVGWLKDRGRRLLYDHIMIDETQDLSPVEIAVVLDTVDKNQPVTLAGDTAQKIIRDSGFVSWDDLLADLGYAEGHTATLKTAYRSTHEIMRLSQDVLGPYANENPVATRHGAEVELHRFSDPGQAVDFLGEALRDLMGREPMANVAVIARHPAQAIMYYNGLEKAEVSRLNLVLEEDFSFAPGVEVTELRQVKGLEFDYVIMAETNAESYPDNEEARHLFHVGATRAAHQLWIVSTNTPSPILPKWLLENE
jgi:DNA helicase-2/ATP-dependent DNA helicase PcrA